MPRFNGDDEARQNLDAMKRAAKAAAAGDEPETKTPKRPLQETGQPGEKRPEERSPEERQPEEKWPAAKQPEPELPDIAAETAAPEVPETAQTGKPEAEAPAADVPEAQPSMLRRRGRSSLLDSVRSDEAAAPQEPAAAPQEEPPAVPPQEQPAIRRRVAAAPQQPAAFQAPEPPAAAPQAPYGGAETAPEKEDDPYAGVFAEWDLLPPQMTIRRVRRK